MSNRIVKQAGLLQAEIDRLRAALMAWENREGSCCPEGVPFERVIEKLKAELEAAQETITALNKRVKEEEARANGIGNRIAKEKAEADCKRIRLERDRLRGELGAVTELLNAELINAQHCETLKAENAQLAASLVRIVRFPIHSEPTGGAYAMQDIARAALSNVCPECGGTGGVDSGGSTPWGAPINLPCPSCEATRKENSIALRELLLPAIDLLQLAISRACWPHEEIVHKELSRLRSLCGEEAQV